MYKRCQRLKSVCDLREVDDHAIDGIHGMKQNLVYN